ncbi:hypothetical protein P9112_013142 [Eukaryota sp. TZLM1-RC]
MDSSPNHSLDFQAKGLHLQGKASLLLCVPILFFIGGGVLFFIHLNISHSTLITVFPHTTMLLDITFKDNLRMVTNLDVSLWKCPHIPDRVIHPPISTCADFTLVDGERLVRRMNLLKGSNVTVNFNPVFRDFLITPNMKELKLFEQGKAFQHYHHCFHSSCHPPISLTIPKDLMDVAFLWTTPNYSPPVFSRICVDLELVSLDISPCDLYCRSDHVCEISQQQFKSFHFLLKGSNQADLLSNNLVKFVFFSFVFCFCN